MLKLQRLSKSLSEQHQGDKDNYINIGDSQERCCVYKENSEVGQKSFAEFRQLP